MWIGDGELRTELSSSNIKVTGWISRDEALRQAIKADVFFLLPSLWEGLPISLLEAMYMRKKTCVVSNVIGNRDVILSERNGYVCNTIEDYIKAIEEVKNEDLSFFLTEQAYSDIVENYNTSVMAAKYANLYNGKMCENE